MEGRPPCGIAMDKTDLIGGLDLTRLGPATESPALQAQTSSREKPGKSRRRLPAHDEGDELELNEAPRHQIDRLA